MRKALISLMLCLLAPLTARAAMPMQDTEAPFLLRQVQDGVHRELTRLDERLARAAARLAQTGLDGEPARAALRDLCQMDPNVIDALTMDDLGRVRAVEPRAYHALEGGSLHGQAHIQRMLRDRVPVMSEFFQSKQGLPGVALVRPVMGEGGRLLGAVSLLLRTSSLLGRIIDPLLIGLDDDLWVMEAGGRILFDPDPEEIGLNLFSDPVYRPFPELRELGRRIAGGAAGSGAYTFLGKRLGDRPVPKQCIWTSVGLHGCWWRLVMIRAGQGQAGPVRRGLADLGLPKLDAALSGLARDPQLVASLARGGDDVAKRMLMDFFLDHPGLYSVQWCDNAAVVRLGYPLATTPLGHDVAAEDNPGARAFTAAVKAAQPASLEAGLMEGGKGLFHLEPVGAAGQHLGMLYYIRIVP